MATWTGLYKDSEEAKGTLEDDIERGLYGHFRYELPGGGTLDERYYPDGGYRWDAYSPSDSPKGYFHVRLSSRNGYEPKHD